ncbi:MAG TPA: histidine kinase [Caulobacteraceae bacterium]|jgi:two-component system sensor histidine kinase UhpB|nr:histidine kinase [Caulobacteraceae bacterium]
MSLRFRIVAAVVLVLVLGSGLGLALAGWQARQWLRGELISAQASGGLAVTRAYADLGRSDAPDRDLRALIATFDGDRHMQALLIGPGGQVLAASRLAPMATPPAWFGALLRQPIEPVRLTDPANARMSVELRPVYINDTAAVWPEFLDLTLVLAISCLGGAALIWALVGQALKPLRAIGEVLPRIGAGDYAAVAPERGPPELVRLARGVNEMAGRLAAMRGRNRALEEQILTLQDEERADIARDLHDEMGPHLFAANVDAAMAANLIASGRPEVALAQVRSIQAAITHMQRLVRDILGRLRPTRLAELGLSAAILDLIEFWRARRPNIRFETRLPVDGEGFSEAVQETAYRLVQESLSNAVRHGAPTTIGVSLEPAAGELRIEVSNDGAPATAVQPGFGLTGMAERVRAAGGRLEAGPKEPGGWRVTAVLPLAGQPREEAA